MNDIDDRLMKIIALARDGVGGEQEAAVAMVQRICIKQGLDFDDVMQATDEREYMLEINFRNQAEEDVMAQVCFRFAITEKHPDLQVNQKAKVFFYTTTPGKHIETVNAAAVYLKAFRVEQKKLMKHLVGAFSQKHQLFSPIEKPTAPMTWESFKEAERRRALMQDMDDVTINKQLEA